MNIFISYRRDDSAVAARLLHRELQDRFGAGPVFMDIDDIGYGDDFVDVIDERLAKADVVIVVIGPRWQRIIDERLRGDDWVRHEVARSLELRAAGLAPSPLAPARRGRPLVLPVLLDDTDWPAATLPQDIAPLQRLSALKFRKASLKADLNELLQAVQGQTFEEQSRQLKGELRAGRVSRWAAPAIGLLLLFAAWISLFDLLALDTRLAAATVALSGSPSSADSGAVVLIAIDENTVKAVGRKFDSSWRAEHGRLVERAAAAGAKRVAFDIAMPDESPADAGFAQALSALQSRMSVIIGVQSRSGDGPGISARLAPLVAWGVACAGKRLGRAMLMPLAVKPARQLQPAIWPSLALSAFSGGGAVESLDAMALRLQVRVPARQESPGVDFFVAETVVASQDCNAIGPGDLVASQWIDPKPIVAQGGAVPRVAYEQVLAGDAAALKMLAGRVAIVGVLLRDDDRFKLPLTAGAAAEPWGSELVAAQVDAMLQGRAIRPLGALWQWLVMTALALAGAALTWGLRHRAAWQRRLAMGAALVVLLLGVGLWYRLELQLVALHHSIGALLLGSWLAGRLIRRSSLGA